MDTPQGQPNPTTINAMINLSGAIGALKVIKDENNEVESIIRSLESLVRELRMGNVILLNLLENNNVPIAKEAETKQSTNSTDIGKQSEGNTAYAAVEPINQKWEAPAEAPEDDVIEYPEKNRRRKRLFGGRDDV